MEAGEWTISIRPRREAGEWTVETFDSSAELIGRLPETWRFAASHYINVHVPVRATDEERRTIRELGFIAS